MNDVPGLMRRGLPTIALGLLACDGSSDAADAEPAYPVLHSRQLAIGDRITQQELACSDGRSRRVADRGVAQVVTFASLGDCSSCASHMTGVDSIYSRRELKLEMFSVIYGPGAREPDIVRRMAPPQARPACTDQRGVFWEALDLSHTPLTVLLIDGRIAYMHDAPLDSAEDWRRLTGALRAGRRPPRSECDRAATCAVDLA